MTWDLSRTVVVIKLRRTSALLLTSSHPQNTLYFIYNILSHSIESLHFISCLPIDDPADGIASSGFAAALCLVQVELEAVGFQFEPYRWRHCGVTWDSSRTVVVIKLQRTSALTKTFPSREQDPRSHHKAANSMQTHPAVRWGSNWTRRPMAS